MALLAVLAFAVGIGSTTAIFAVINGVLLRPLPYADAGRFVVLFGANTTEPSRFSAHKFPDLVEYERRLSSVDAFGWFSLADFNLTSPGEPQRVAGATLTPSLARSLGVTPHLGGWFVDETGVVISTRLWRRLGGSPTIVGSPVTIDGRSFTITGVMPPDFRFPIAGTVPLLTRTDLWTYLDPAGQGLNRGDSIYFSYARRKPGITVAQVEADARRVAAQIAALDPAAHPAYSAKVVALREMPFIELRAELFVLFGAAGLLLLISCANVATLLLARSVSRVRETAIRVALGAARRHLALRYFVESLLVSLAGAAAGMVLSIGLVRAIALGGSELIPQAEDIGIDWKVFGAATLLAFVASALASAAPLWQAVRIAPNAVLADGVRASASTRVRRLSHALVVGEIGLAFMLLAVSTVLVVHLDALTRVSPGFIPDDLVAFEVAAPRTVFRTKGRWAYQKRLLDAVAQMPGVSTAAFVNQLPLDGCCLGGVLYPEGTTTVDTRRISFLIITDDYFATMGIPLRAGRFLTERDTSEGLLFCVVNQAAAKRYWPNQNPVGAYARLNLRDGNRVQVVGVVGDVRNEALKRPPEAELYLLASLIPVSPMKFVVRAPLPPSRLIADIQRTVQRIDPTVVVHDARSMTVLVHDSLQLERMSSAIMTFFALAALLMATLGIYGVVSYSVRQRTVELGTRMAVGAVPRDLLKLVVGGALKMAALGVTLGGFAVVGGVWLLVRYLEVRDISAAPFIFSTIVVVAIVAGAAYTPAWRASLLPPMVAIRDDPASAWQSVRLSVHRAIDSVKQATTSHDSPALSPTALLTEFVDAARAAESFADALRAAVAILCARLGIARALLLQRHSNPEYHCRVAIGSMEPWSRPVPAHGFLLKRLEACPHPLSFSRADFDVLVRWAEEQRPDLVDEMRWLRDIDVRTAVPLRTRKEILGVLLLGPPAGDRLSPQQKEVLPACADQFALMMENARLTDRVVEQEKVRRDLALAVEVQQRLLPAAAPSTALADFAGASVPARSIGGDYYDFIQIGDHRIGIALADVSGKGIAAALIMAAVQASLRIISSEVDIPLPRLAARLNEFLYRATPANKYATFFYAQVDAESRELRYVNAGHNPPYLVRTGSEPEASGESGGSSGETGEFEIRELTAGGAVVGMFPGLSYEEASISLRSGDLLVAFTDGVTEAQNPEEEEFGEDRLKDLLRRLARLPAPEISARISHELNDWIKDAAQYDDLTFVVMKVN